MDDHTGDPETEDGEVESLASRLSGIKASSVPRSPVEPVEPEPEPETKTVEASEEGAAAPKPAKSQEGLAVTEAAGEEGPGELESPAEAQEEAEPGEPREAGPEEPAEPEPEEPEEEEEEEEGEEEEAAAAEPGRKEVPSQVSLQQATAGKEEAAAAWGAEREGQVEEEEESEASEASEASEEGLEARVPRKDEDELRNLDEGLVLEPYDWSEEVRKQQEQQLRAELLEQYRALVVERGRYQRYNIYLQHKIFEALRKKKGVEAAAEAPGGDRGAEPEAPEKEQASGRPGGPAEAGGRRPALVSPRAGPAEAAVPREGLPGGQGVAALPGAQEAGGDAGHGQLLDEGRPPGRSARGGADPGTGG